MLKMCAVAGMVLFVPLGAGAQQMAMAGPPVIQQSTSVSAKPVTLSLKGVTLENALRKIAQQAGMGLSYTPSDVDLGRVVTVHVANVSVDAALRATVAGTNVRAVVAPNGQTIVLSRASGTQQSQGTIVGKVVHAKTKQPLAGVRIVLDNAQDGVVTGEDGTFRISAPAGEHTVQVRMVGFGRQARKVVVAAEQAISVEVVLEPSASVLDEVIVTGTVVATERRAIATPITVITGAELERRGITRIDHLFRGEVPGVYAMERGVREYSSGDVGEGVKSWVNSRGAADLGGNPKPLKTYVDGVELLDAAYLGTLDPQSIERIEIVSGPQAATIYGSGAMGGVMQIFTKRGVQGNQRDLTATLRFGMLQSSFSQSLTPTHHDVLSLQGGYGPVLSYSGNLSYLYSGQWQPGLYNRQYGGSLGATHTSGKLTVGVSSSITATVRGTYSGTFTGDYGYLALVRSGEFFRTSENLMAHLISRQVSTTSNHMLTFNADYRISPHWQHHVTLGRSQNVLALEPEAPKFYGSLVGSDTLFGVKRVSGQRITWNYNTSFIAAPSWLSSTLTFGANGSSGDQISVQGSTISASASTVVGSSGTGGPSVSLPIDDHSWGGFGSWQVGFFHRLYTTLGFRVERNPAYGRNIKFDMTPTNGLSYTIEAGNLSAKLFASYGRATRTPPASQKEEEMTRDLFYEPAWYPRRLANPDLRPEYSRGPQGGLELYVGNRGSFTINHYRQTTSDLIQMMKVDSIWGVRATGEEGYRAQLQYRNAAMIRQYGWEGTGTVNAGPLTFKGTYSWNEGRVLWSDQTPYVCCYLKAGESFLNVPTRFGNVTITYAKNATSIVVGTNFRGAVNQTATVSKMVNAISAERLRMYGIHRGTLSGLVIRSAPYAKSDVVATQRISRRLSATLNVINVGNSFEADQSELNPSLGRQTTFGISYRFGIQ